jgi:hypothetical protein
MTMFSLYEATEMTLLAESFDPVVYFRPMSAIASVG